MAKKNPNKTFFRSPLFTALVAFIVLFVVFWGFYSKNYNSNTNQTAAISDETANWKTYTSTKLGFSIRYPDSVVISDEIDSLKQGSVSFILKSEKNLNYYSRSVQLDIYFQSNSDTGPLEVFKRSHQPPDSCKNCYPATEEISFNNAVGLSVVDTDQLDYYLTNNRRTKPTLRILINTVPNSRNGYNGNPNIKTIGLFEKMIKTFKFID